MEIWTGIIALICFFGLLISLLRSERKAKNIARHLEPSQAKKYLKINGVFDLPKPLYFIGRALVWGTLIFMFCYAAVIFLGHFLK